MNKDSIKVIPLGGLGEIGKNITAIEYNNEIIIIDCGISFPDEDMYGVDLVIPDIRYLLDKKDKVKGMFLTHGHEDHIGAIPYILKQLNIPVYGTKLTIGLVENKLKEHDLLNHVDLNPVKAGQSIKLENMKIEFIRVTHSIADACGLAIHTPLGIILHTGDFKIDYTPIDGRMTDLNRIATLGKKGVLLLMADSTNVERSGHSISEKTIGETLNRIFTNAKGRIIVATFASNIHRMQQIVNASVMQNRKVVFSGRSMENISQVAMELGYLHIPTEYIVDIDDISKYPNNEITIITTGSQGESMAGLSRIAYGSHRKIIIEPDDFFIISASPIPGNDKLVSRVINQLFKKGVDVIYEDLEEIHVSGHAYQEELKLIHSLVKPKYFMPVHGEYRHLKHHKDLAIKLGMKPQNVFTLETGQVLEITNEGVNANKRVHTGVIFVDGLGVGDVGNIVLRDRRDLAKDGMVTIVVAINRDSYSIVAGPDVITRGFIYAREAEDLINKIKEVSKEEIEKCLEQEILEWQILKTNIKRSIEQLLYHKTKRRPIVFPIIMEV
ncbi:MULTISPECIES: ribonuclease J [unclassified Romboutsia]|uniref:ribonuclease J n=1 Tax=unclassified Romboutsia TaxID=2626894 RepID=UPI00189AA843|nr:MULTISPECIES: ribonuclease J [unclassified Romboutsia]MDB8806277.1 ribonuclease J [Romboutsia sp. 1001216sp1]MDB8809014.1 ribonuclease J [Romboutsia sp. 1001216sp1]MDB8811925.1 ribonuclease J [Romboutsia sp. 1001216sp1]MDB8817671.1 ribonuclease J [Romboutsia sp. 1001216sp1]MDB8820453.1 ribonuclease J [Romboutsia sp. 1001216sp1]